MSPEDICNMGLLEMSLQWKVQERSLQGGQLQRRRATALDDCKITRGEVLIQLWNVFPDFHSARRIEARCGQSRATHQNHPKCWQILANEGVCLCAEFQQLFTDRSAADRADDKGLCAVSQFLSNSRLVCEFRRIEGKDVPYKITQCLRPFPTIGKHEAEPLVGNILLFSYKYIEV